MFAAWFYDPKTIMIYLISMALVLHNGIVCEIESP